MLGRCSVCAALGGKPVYVLNGPNIDLLGKHQAKLYWRETLQDVDRLRRETDPASAIVIIVIGWGKCAGEDVVLGW